MKKVELLFLSQEEVIHLGLTMNEVISVVEKVFREHGMKRVENPPKPGIHPQPNAFIHAMPGYLRELKAAGLKWVSSFPSNAQMDLPTIMGLIILNDVVTGQPLAIMDCRWITAVRTGAASAVAAKYLAKKDTEVVGIVGAGVQGRYNLLALKEVLPQLRLAQIYDVKENALQGFVADMNESLPFRVEACGSVEEALVGADVIVTATSKLEKPIYEEKWIGPGALVLPVHHRGWQNEALHKVDKFVSDDWAQLSQANQAVGGFYGELPELYAELGEIVTGSKPGRENEQERIIDVNYGLAIEDIGMAQAIYTRATQIGLGTRLPLMEEDLPTRA